VPGVVPGVALPDEPAADVPAEEPEAVTEAEVVEAQDEAAAEAAERADGEAPEER
jgi:hypothetical protein